jgi:hypothetical protein
MPQLEPKRFQFTSSDGLSIACVKWSDSHHVRGVVQIAHGLGEHMGRYCSIALTSIAHNLYIVGRHEMLYEINRRDVITNLLVWISGILEKRS